MADWLQTKVHRLLASASNIDTNPVQHMSGFGYNPRRNRESRFEIFDLLTMFGSLPAFNHNQPQYRKMTTC